MKQFLTVFRFTYLDAARKKSFRISTIIILALILAACIAARLLGNSSDGPQASGEADYESAAGELYYLDEFGAIPEGERVLADMGYAVKPIGEDGVQAALEKVKQESDCAIIKVTPGGEPPFIELTVKDFMSGLNAEGIATALTNAWKADALANLGVNDAAIAISQSWPNYSTSAAGEMDAIGYTLGIVFSMLMFFAVYFYGLSVANSVSMEKTSRVMETLVVSAKPKSILAGKCLAMGAVGLTQMAAMIAFAALCFKAFVPSGTALFGMALDFSGVTPGLGILMVMYFLLGYALYAMMNAVCGASVSRIEDVSSAMMPVSMISLASFYIGYFTSLFSQGSGVMDKIAMYVPFCSPFGMPFRILNGSAGAADIAISLTLLVVTIIAVSMISVRMYTAGVMYYGKRLKLKDMFKLKP